MVRGSSPSRRAASAVESNRFDIFRLRRDECFQIALTERYVTCDAHAVKRHDFRYRRYWDSCGVLLVPNGRMCAWHMRRAERVSSDDVVMRCANMIDWRACPTRLIE